MALFKISKGLKNNLPSELTEGYCWYTYNDSKFYIDYKDENGTLVRKALNAQDAETLTGASLSTILNSSDVEIPTSKAVLDALNGKADAVHTHDASDIIGLPNSDGLPKLTTQTVAIADLEGGAYLWNYDGEKTLDYESDTEAIYTSSVLLNVTITRYEEGGARKDFYIFDNPNGHDDNPGRIIWGSVQLDENQTPEEGFCWSKSLMYLVSRDEEEVAWFGNHTFNGNLEVNAHESARITSPDVLLNANSCIEMTAGENNETYLSFDSGGMSLQVNNGYCDVNTKDNIYFHSNEGNVNLNANDSIHLTAEAGDIIFESSSRFESDVNFKGDVDFTNATVTGLDAATTDQFNELIEQGIDGTIARPAEDFELVNGTDLSGKTVTIQDVDWDAILNTTNINNFSTPPALVTFTNGSSITISSGPYDLMFIDGTGSHNIYEWSWDASRYVRVMDSYTFESKSIATVSTEWSPSAAEILSQVFAFGNNATYGFLSAEDKVKLDDMVDLTSDQTICGKKKFTTLNLESNSFTWSADLLSSARNISGTTLTFNIAMTDATQFLSPDKVYFQSSGGYELYCNWPPYLFIRKNEQEVICWYDTYNNGWQLSNYTLPDDFGYIINFGSDPTESLAYLNNMMALPSYTIGFNDNKSLTMPDASGTVATQEWVQAQGLGGGVDTTADYTWTGDHTFNGSVEANHIIVGGATFGDSGDNVFNGSVEFNSSVDFSAASIYKIPMGSGYLVDEEDYLQIHHSNNLFLSVNNEDGDSNIDMYSDHITYNSGSHQFVGNVDFTDATVTGLPTFSFDEATGTLTIVAPVKN